MILCFSVHQLTNLADKHKKSQRKSENLLQSRNPMKSPKIRNTRIKEVQRCLLNNQCLFRHVCNRDCAKQKVHDIIWNKTSIMRERGWNWFSSSLFYWKENMRNLDNEHYFIIWKTLEIFNNSNLFSRLR